jgi:hypothetical protein
MSRPPPAPARIVPSPERTMGWVDVDVGSSEKYRCRTYTPKVLALDEETGLRSRTMGYRVNRIGIEKVWLLDLYPHLCITFDNRKWDRSSAES